jgi:multiple sugar transport system ATP-binding protein
VAGFIGQPNMNFLKTSDTDINKKKLVANIGDLTLDLPVDSSNTKSGDEIEIGIRPEDLKVSTAKGGIPMSVDVVEHIGATVILYGSILGNSNFCAVLSSDSVIKPGDTVNLTIDPLKCHAFNSSGQALRRN